MFDHIHSLAVRIRGIVNRTQYVFSIVKWAMESLGKIADILATFPPPPLDHVESKTEPEKRPAEPAGSNGTGTDGNPVP